MSAVFLCFSSIKLELSLEYPEDKAKQKGRRNCFPVLLLYIVFDSVTSIQTGLTAQNLPCMSTHTAVLLTTGPYCLSITDQTLKKMVLSSKIYKEAICLSVGGLCDVKHTECWYFQLSKKEKEIQFTVASQTVKLNLFIFIKSNEILRAQCLRLMNMIP